MKWLHSVWVLVLLVVVRWPGFAMAAETESRAASANAALQYWLAFCLMPNVQDEKVDAATTDSRKFGFAVPVSGEQAKVFQGRYAQQALIYLHRGAARSCCDWGFELRKDGVYARSDVFTGKTHSLARLSCLRARWQFEHGAWDKGFDDVIATMLMARHASRQMLYYDHFCYTTENIARGTLAAYLPRMPAQARANLLKRVDALPVFSPMRDALLRFDDVLNWLADHLPQAEREGRLLDLLAEFGTRQQAEAVVKQGGSAENLVKLLQETRPLMRQCADLMLLKPAECDRVFHERYERRLKANPIAALVAPDYRDECRENAQEECRRLMFRAAVDVVDRGKTALANYPDPYGNGPFQYLPFEGGFELRSALFYSPIHIYLVVGARKN